MAAIVDYFKGFGRDDIDPRMSELPFTQSATPSIILVLLYLGFIKIWGPKFMKHRKPYDLRITLLVYNSLQVLVNFFLAAISTYFLFVRKTHKLSCPIPLPNDHPYKYLERNLFYMYAVLKVVDYMDTIFFVLRKSYKQITFLHVYHHILMGLGGYAYLHYHGSGGVMLFLGYLNAIVHTVMYFYYLLAALRPNAKSTLWWKKYVTILQILQFVMLMLYNVTLKVFVPECPIPLIHYHIALVQSSTFMYMFGKFYYKAYVRKDNKAEKIKKQQ